MFLYDAVVLSSTLPSLTWDAAGSGVRVLLSLHASNVYSVQSSYYLFIRWKITPYAPEQEKSVLFSAWISFVYNQCEILRCTSVGLSISENRTSKIVVIGYWVQSKQGQTPETSSYVNLRTWPRKVMVIGWDARGIVNGEVSHPEQAQMRAYYHMEEDKIVGEWNLLRGSIQVSGALSGGRDNRLMMEVTSARCPHACITRAWHGCDEDNIFTERVYPVAGAVEHALFWGPSCVCVTGSKRRIFACDNDVSRWRDGETDRNFIDIDRGQAWVLGVDANGLKSWKHKETQLTAVKDVAAPAPPPEPPPTPK